MTTIILSDGSEWRGSSKEGWTNTATGEKICNTKMKARTVDGQYVVVQS